jgi:hypothetical protein
MSFRVPSESFVLYLSLLRIAALPAIPAKSPTAHRITHIRQRVVPRMLAMLEGPLRAAAVHLIKLTATQRSRASGWMQDRADPHARERALASQDPPSGVTPDETGELRIGQTRSGATGISLDLNR